MVNYRCYRGNYFYLLLDVFGCSTYVWCLVYRPFLSIAPVSCWVVIPWQYLDEGLPPCAPCDSSYMKALYNIGRGLYYYKAAMGPNNRSKQIVVPYGPERAHFDNTSIGGYTFQYVHRNEGLRAIIVAGKSSPKEVEAAAPL